MDERRAIAISLEVVLSSISQQKKPSRAHISVVSVKRLETGRGGMTSSRFPVVGKIVSCMEAAGIEFTVEQHGEIVPDRLGVVGDFKRSVRN